MDLAVDDTNPRRRIAFGTTEQAQQFVDQVPGWSLHPADDPAQPPITGDWSGTTQPQRD
jgi:hypothetical protein